MAGAINGADGLIYRKTSFVGRSQEIQTLTQLLSDPHYQLVTLVGPGGIGKTRLALEIAERVGHLYRDGVYFVALQPLRSHLLIPVTIAHTFGLTLSEHQDPLQKLIAYLQEQHILLILDNFEHLVEGASQIASMISELSGVQILVTSREPLNLHQEWQWIVAGLDYPQTDTEEEIDSYSAVQLFCERALQVNPGFHPDSCLHALVRICSLVEGIPLAIEIAANWAKILPCEAIADAIQNSLDFLVSRENDIAERHSSMRAVFDCSWELLTLMEQTAFERLSIFQGGFSLDAAEKVAGTDLHTLALLVDKSFIRQDQIGRYDIHELLRQYGWQRLSQSHDLTRTAENHAAYFARLLQDSLQDLQGAQQAKALDLIETNFDNIRLAWSYAVDHRLVAWIDGMIDSLEEFGKWYGWFSQVYALFAEAVRVFSHDPDTMESALLGRILIRSGDVDLEQINHAIEIAQRVGNEREVGFCARIRGIYHFQRQDFRLALIDLQTARDICQHIGDQSGLMAVTLDSAYAMGTIGDQDAVYSYLKQLAALAHEAGHQGYLYYVHFHTAWADSFDGHYRSGQESMQQAFEIATRMGFRIKMADCAGALAFFAFLLGDFEAARHWSNDDLKVVMRSRVPGSQGFAKIVQAHITCVEGRYHEALRLSQEAFALVKPHPHRERSTARVFAMTYCGLGDFDLASLHAQRVLSEERSHGCQLWILPTFAFILAHQGDFEKATQILGLSFTHPASARGWMQRWELLADLQCQLEDQLGSEHYREAWEQGTQLSLPALIDELLLRKEHQSGQPLVEPLTQRELEVLHLIAAGLSNHEIADTMTVVEGTIKTHVHNLSQKLGAKNRTQAVARARALHLI